MSKLPTVDGSGMVASSDFDADRGQKGSSNARNVSLATRARFPAYLSYPRSKAGIWKCETGTRGKEA